jgi:hypothetical protein
MRKAISALLTIVALSNSAPVETLYFTIQNSPQQKVLFLNPGNDTLNSSFTVINDSTGVSEQPSEQYSTNRLPTVMGLAQARALTGYAFFDASGRRTRPTRPGVYMMSLEGSGQRDKIVVLR